VSWTLILLISVSWVARITDTSHQHPAKVLNWKKELQVFFFFCKNLEYLHLHINWSTDTHCWSCSITVAPSGGTLWPYKTMNLGMLADKHYFTLSLEDLEVRNCYIYTRLQVKSGIEPAKERGPHSHDSFMSYRFPSWHEANTWLVFSVVMMVLHLPTFVTTAVMTVMVQGTCLGCRTE
jgi:hypothetical protein